MKPTFPGTANTVTGSKTLAETDSTRAARQRFPRG